MDTLDKAIITILQRDGRASNAGIAREVGVSEGTVRRRLKQLQDDNLIRIVAMLDPGRLGYRSEALLGIHVDPDKLDMVADQMSDLEEIAWVSITTGNYDIFAWAAFETPDALGEFLRTRVGTIFGVRRIETFVNLAIKKRGHGVMI
jgi:Lrp/AsnC family transcriptional regulator for asnA, asnC and gidA